MSRATLGLLLLALLGGCERNGDGQASSADTGNAVGNASAGARVEDDPSGEAAAQPAAQTTRPTGTTQPARQPAAADDGDVPERLLGTWVAKNVDTSMGAVDIELTFREDGPVRILAWSDLPLVGQVRNKEAPYEVRDHTIQSDAIRGGTSVEYRFNEQGQLVIEYKDGKTVTFDRA